MDPDNSQDDQELQDRLVVLQEKLYNKLKQFTFSDKYETLDDLIFVVAYQNNSRHTYRLTRAALENLLKKYKDL